MWSVEYGVWSVDVILNPLLFVGVVIHKCTLKTVSELKFKRYFSFSL